MRQMARPRKREQPSDFQRRLRRWGVLGGMALVVLALGGWTVYQVFWSKPGVAIPIQQPSYRLRAGETVSYNSLPPTSGPYAGAGVGWGIHEMPIPNEIQVAMLRRGGVLIQYRPVESPALPDPVAEGLKRLVGRWRTFEPQKYCKLLLAPYALLDKKIALTAWGRLDKFDAEEITAESERRIREFIDKLSDAYNPERVRCP